MINLADIIQLKFPNANPLTDFTIQDNSDGNGPFVAKWNVPNVPEPTQEELDQWATELDLQYRQQQARNARIYPSWQEQADMQYWDGVNGTTVWQDTITAIKEANPIPQE